MSLFETAPQTSRNTNESLSRIVVRLCGVAGYNLSEDEAIKLNRTMHATMKGKEAKADSRVVFAQGKYLVDFAIREGETADTALPRVIADTDAGLLQTQLPAEVEEARLAPSHLLDFGRVSTEAWQALPELTTARELFGDHHSQALEAELTRFLFDVA